MNSSKSLKHLQPLPPSDDYIWEGGEKKLVDMDKVPNLVCADGGHDYEINFSEREYVCKRCGMGHRFKVSAVSLVDGHLVDNITQKRLT